MTSNERKLNALNKCKNKLTSRRNETSKINKIVNEIDDALDDLIGSDNVDTSSVREQLSTQIEEHPDFLNAVTSIKRAISNTQNAITTERIQEQMKKQQL